MHSLKKEHEHQSITERWQVVDDYFECISMCDINDGTCITTCVNTHLNIDDGSDLLMAS